MKTLLIVPTFNERDNLQRLAEQILASQANMDLLIVDDASPDGTGEIADALARRSERVHVLHRTGKLGLGTAYLDGFRYGLAKGYDRLVEMDADLSHRPEDLPQLIKASETADIVIGSRWVKGGHTENWSLLRRLISRGGSLYARTLLRLPVKDCTSGFKCFRREVLQHIDFDAVSSNGFGFQVEMNYLCRSAGFRFAEIPITFPDRAAGQSKMSPKIFLEALFLVWRLRFPFSGGLPNLVRTAAAGAGRGRLSVTDREAAGN